MTRREFKVNDEITLRLEDGKTIIYVNDEKFLQCTHLIISASLGDLSKKKVESIDDIESFHDEHLGEGVISPEEEFWGHCSNLQAWAEHDFDSRLLHSNLAFPLLKELTEINPRKYETRFKEEICRRMKEGNHSTIYFLYKEGYVERLTREEFWSVFDLDFNVRPLINIENLFNEASEKKIYFKHEISTEVITPSSSEENSIKFLIYNNKITAITFHELEVLNNSLLSDCIEELSKLPYLEALNIYGCGNLIHLAENINLLRNLKWLFLEGNNITLLPNEIGKLKKLEELYLENNNISSLPNDFSLLNNLEFLDLSSNKFEIISNELCQLKNIKKILLKDNKIREIPHQIANLKTLIKLDMRGNDIKRNLTLLNKMSKTIRIEI
ncbi:MAG: leucine-rich repeat domain-containing protein [Promethearchaeota archaeon]